MSPLLETFANASLRGFRAGGGGSNNSFELISTVYGDNSATSITFSSIPSTYTHLQLRTVNRVTSGSAGSSYNGLQINGDNSSTQYKSYLRGIPSTAQGGAGSGTYIDMFETPDNLSEANTYSASIIDIPNYTSSVITKTVKVAMAYVESGGTKYIYLGSGFRNNTAAITSLTYLNGAGRAFSSASRFALYGIKGA